MVPTPLQAALIEILGLFDGTFPQEENRSTGPCRAIPVYLPIFSSLPHRSGHYKGVLSPQTTSNAEVGSQYVNVFRDACRLPDSRNVLLDLSNRPLDSARLQLLPQGRSESAHRIVAFYLCPRLCRGKPGIRFDYWDFGAHILTSSSV
jgi:hypothetical protein